MGYTGAYDLGNGLDVDPDGEEGRVYGQDTEGTWACPECESDMYLLVDCPGELYRCTNPACGIELYDNNLVDAWSRAWKQAQEDMTTWDLEQETDNSELPF